MHDQTRLAAALALAVALACASSCGDDPLNPPADPWMDLSTPVQSGSLLALAAHGADVIAVGAQGRRESPEAVALWSSGGSFSILNLPLTPTGATFSGAAFDGGGGAVIVGGNRAGQPFACDERADWTVGFLPVDGFLNAVARRVDDVLVAVGTGRGGFAATRWVPGGWNPDRAGFTTPQEKGLVSVSCADGVCVACGWDDATLQPILRWFDGSTWSTIPGPGGSAIPEIREEYRVVLLKPGGSLWLGGATIETTGGNDRFVARLAGRPAKGNWFEAVLPDAAGLEAVNDILWASDGTLYLACGEMKARVLRYGGAAWYDEGPGTPGQVLALAESQGVAQTILAAGWRQDATGQPSPLLRSRPL